MIQVEICTPSLASAWAAKEGGAERVELCRALECGGLTPSESDIYECVHTLGLRTHVLVRPRAGNFFYNASEVAEIEHTLLRCKELGAHAVVVGFLDGDGHVDEELTRRMVQLAAPMEVTFHRAFDEAQQDPVEALQAVIRTGSTRLLTSGQAHTAPDGAAVIKQLVDYTKHLTLHTKHFHILAGSGVTPLNVRNLVEKTGVREVHGSCKTVLPDGTFQTDADQVRKLLSAVSEM